VRIFRWMARLMRNEEVNVTMRYALPSHNELAQIIDRTFS